MVALSFDRRIGERRPTPPLGLEWLPKSGRGAVALVHDGDQRLTGVVVDVSVTGAALDLRDAVVEPGDVAFVTFEGGSVEVCVRRADPPTSEGTTRVGVEFVRMEPDAQRELFDYLGRGRPTEQTWLHRAR